MDKGQYEGVFVFAEQRGGVLQPVARELLGKGRELAAALDQRVTALLLGFGVAGLAQECVAYGADDVVVVDDECLQEYLTEPYVQAAEQVVRSKRPSVILLGATTIGRDLGPRLSARLATGLTADCTGLDISQSGDLLMTRPAFGGNLMATIVCKEHRPQMSTVRPGVMKAARREDFREGNVECFAVRFDASKFRVKLKSSVVETREKVDITEARILVSGGRGVGSSEGFGLLQSFASAIGGEVSSSRAMVDAGVMPHDRQVGQTGKTVRPDVYFACGISGAIQHLAGMEESEYIIAINKDKDAPIFQTADLGIVGDLKQIIPLLTQKLASR